MAEGYRVRRHLHEGEGEIGGGGGEGGAVTEGVLFAHDEVVAAGEEEGDAGCGVGGGELVCAEESVAEVEERKSQRAIPLRVGQRSGGGSSVGGREESGVAGEVELEGGRSEGGVGLGKTRSRVSGAGGLS